MAAVVCRGADAVKQRLSMPSPARRGGSSRQSTKTITAAALALRFALVAVASIIDAYKPLGLRYTDVDYDVLKDGARAMMQGGSPFQRATYRYSPLVGVAAAVGYKDGATVAKLVFCLMDVLLGNAMGQLASQRGASSCFITVALQSDLYRSVHARVLGRGECLSGVESATEQAVSRESGPIAGPGDSSAALSCHLCCALLCTTSVSKRDDAVYLDRGSGV